MHNIVVGPNPNLKIVVSELGDAKTIEPLFQGIDVVVVAIGAWSKEGQSVITIQQDAAKCYLPAMRKAGVKRMHAVFGASMLGDEMPKPNPNAPIQWRAQSVDMIECFKTIVEEDVDYTIWCPANYPGGNISSEYKVRKRHFPEDCVKEVTTGMMAHAILEELSKNEFTKERVAICRTDKEGNVGSL